MAKKAAKKTDTPVDPSEGFLDDDATPADDLGDVSEEEFLKGGKKAAKRDADEESDEDEEEDDLDGFGFEDEEEE